VVPENAFRKWTPEEDYQLRKLIESSVPVHDIAATLERTAVAVKGRAYLLRISMKLASFPRR
jgi:hypothetical protein